MDAPSLTVPHFVAARTPKELQKAILKVQAVEGGKVAIVAMYFDGRNHICWYLPIRNHGGGVM